MMQIVVDGVAQLVKLLPTHLVTFVCLNIYMYIIIAGAVDRYMCIYYNLCTYNIMMFL